MTNWHSRRKGRLNKARCGFAALRGGLVTPSGRPTHGARLEGSAKLLRCPGRTASTTAKVLCRCRGIIEDVPEIEVPTTDEQRMDANDRRAFTEDEMEMFLWALATMGEGRALRIYITLLETWQRKSTIQALTPRWVNFHKEMITIPAKHFKTRKEKVIDLTPRAAEAIRTEIADKYPGDKPIPLDEPVFGPFDFHQEAVRKWKDRDGNEHQYEDGGVFARACRMAGIDQHGLTPHHVTRHTAATLALENGVSVLGAMAQGGWDSMQSMQRYTHAQLQHARQAARARSRTVVAR